VGDLCRRYLAGGPKTVLDPFLGTGGTLLAMLEGHSVVGVELEAHHHRDAAQNAVHVRRLAALRGYAPECAVLHGDSREVLPAVFGGGEGDGTVTSPPYGDAQVLRKGEPLDERIARLRSEGKHREAEILHVHGRGHFGNMRDAADPADGSITSPPYETALSETPAQAAQQLERIRAKIASGEAKHPEGTIWGRRGAWGGGTAHRYTNGYGGALADADVMSPPYQDARSGWNIAAGQENVRYDPPADGSMTSPPYSDSLSATGAKAGGRQRREAAGEWDRLNAKDRKVGGGSYAADLAADGAVTSPPYTDVASRDRHAEPYAAKDPERAKEYGQDSPSRNVSGYGKTAGQIGNMTLKDGSYQTAMQEIYRACFDATRDGGILVSVTSDFTRKEKGSDRTRIIDLAQVNIAAAAAAGWTPLERWKARKHNVSFWRRLQHQQSDGEILIDYEDVLVFAKGEKCAWEFADWSRLPSRPPKAVREPTPDALFALAPPTSPTPLPAAAPDGPGSAT
jgi:hypothetical protein